ncbi:MAG TPA: quinolinate synthase NadA [Candidatus Acidoferrales bacterium]|nr:quinolinate synthase NadA [Candidatus Acidoferrales bacterium]
MGNRLKELKNDQNAIILAHNYQIGEIQEAADYVGDSFELSRIASQIDCDIVVFCGVDFMAESAYILSPEKTVLLPVKNATCPMSHMITAADVQALRREHPQATVVCYVNTPADVKAKSDICCTSANVINVINSVDSDQVIFVPDINLAYFVQSKTDKEIIAWNGFCPTHENITLGDILMKKHEIPDIEVVVHPECRPEVIEVADYVYGTGGMLRHAKISNAKRMLIGTEVGLLYRLQKENPDKEFYSPSEHAVCPNMKLTTLQKVVDALNNMEYKITVAEDVRVQAKKALDKMLEI